MKCEQHEGQLKTHICLKPSCKNQTICPICIVQDHQNHIAIDFISFKKSLAILIHQHDNPDPLPNISQTFELLSIEYNKLQDVYKELYIKKKEALEINQFRLIDNILNIQSPTSAQQQALKRVIQSMSFYRNNDNQWQFAVNNDNPNYKKIDQQIIDLRNNVNEQLSKIKLIGELFQSFQSFQNVEINDIDEIYQLQKKQISQQNVEFINKKIKNEQVEWFTEDETLKEFLPQSLLLLRRLEDNSDQEEIQKTNIVLNNNNIQQPIKEITQNQLNSVKKYTVFDSQFIVRRPDRKFHSIAPERYIYNNDFTPLRDRRKNNNKQEKLLLKTEKRHYVRKSYNKLKINNTDQRIRSSKKFID